MPADDIEAARVLFDGKVSRVTSEGVAIADGMYAWLLPGAEAFPAWLAGLPRPLPRLAQRHGWLRGVLLFAASTRFETIAVIRAEPGWRTLVALRALLGRRRKLVVLHLIVHPHRTRGAGALVDRAWAPLERAALRRALRAGQVLTEFERERYQRLLGVPPARLVHVPWALRRERAGTLPDRDATGPVVCSGRAFVDWETLFAAARGADWPLVAVCSRDDVARVRALATETGAEVLCEISHERHAALLAGASVVAMPMTEHEISQGHIRLMEANDAGLPVAATRTRSLAGYVTDGEDALLVAAGDAAGLRGAIERLRGDEGERVRRAAFERSQSWTGEDCLAALGRLIATG